jgi:hypothetical protein
MMAIQGIPSPLTPRGLFPRHLHATIASFFVHLPVRGETVPAKGGKDKTSIRKIVHVCAAHQTALEYVINDYEDYYH